MRKVFPTRMPAEDGGAAAAASDPASTSPSAGSGGPVSPKPGSDPAEPVSPDGGAEANGERFRLVVPLDDRPDGIPDPWWDSDAGGLRVGAALKQVSDKDRQLNELRGKLEEAGKSQAPEGGYELRLADGTPDDVRESLRDDPLMGVMHGALAEWGISQDQHDAFLGKVVEVLNPAPESVAESLAATYGARAGAVMDANKTWVDGFKSEDGAGAEVHATLTRMLGFDQGQHAIKAIRDRLAGPSMRDGGETPAPAPDLDEAALRKLMASPAYTDPGHPEYAATQKRVDEGFKRLYPGETITSV